MQPDSQPAKPPRFSGIEHFYRSCTYTAAGLKTACKEAAFRQELLLGLVAVPLSLLLPLDGILVLLLNLCWLAVLSCELLNTAIESVVDLASPAYHELAKRAKDLGSAAVMLALVNAAVVWGLTLWPLLKG
jgi:diacylglycerol kinase (ATP)